MRSLGIKFVRVAEFAWSRFEPEPEKFNFNWLGRFLDLVKNEGLAAVVGTPTASPPKWLVDSMPDMIALDKRPARAFGSRRHYCFSREDIGSSAGKS
jgi:beta-galactosidase